MCVYFFYKYRASDAGGGKHSNAAGDHSCNIRQDISKDIRCQEYVELKTGFN